MTTKSMDLAYSYPMPARIPRGLKAITGRIATKEIYGDTWAMAMVDVQAWQVPNGRLMLHRARVPSEGSRSYAWKISHAKTGCVVLSHILSQELAVPLLWWLEQLKGWDAIRVDRDLLATQGWDAIRVDRDLLATMKAIARHLARIAALKENGDSDGYRMARTEFLDLVSRPVSASVDEDGCVVQRDNHA